MDEKIVIFDFDGTLADSIALAIELYNNHQNEFGYLPMTIEELPDLRKLGYKKAMKAKKLKAINLPKIVMILKKEMRESMSGVKPYGGIVQALEDIKKQGYSLGILTSNQASSVLDFLKVHNFPDFQFVVSEKTLFGKEKALRKIMRRYDLQNENVIYVGDEPRDVSGSRKARIKSIGVSWGLAGREGFAKNIPDKLIDSPSDLLSTVEQLSI